MLLRPCHSVASQIQDRHIICLHIRLVQDCKRNVIADTRQWLKCVMVWGPHNRCPACGSACQQWTPTYLNWIWRRWHSLMRAVAVSIRWVGHQCGFQNLSMWVVFACCSRCKGWLREGSKFFANQVSRCQFLYSNQVQYGLGIKLVWPTLQTCRPWTYFPVHLYFRM